MIPVAGLGTRGLPITKEVPKEMLPVIDIPTIHFIVEEVLSAGIEQVLRIELLFDASHERESRRRFAPDFPTLFERARRREDHRVTATRAR